LSIIIIVTSERQSRQTFVIMTALQRIVERFLQLKFSYHTQIFATATNFFLIFFFTYT